MPDLGAIGGNGTVGTTGGGLSGGGTTTVDVPYINLILGTFLDTTLDIVPQLPTFSFRPTTCRQQNIHRANTLSFGDGYEQRQADGSNTERLEFDLTFENVDQDEGDAIEAFLSARKAVETFNWTPPGKSAGKYVCSEPYSRDWNPDSDGVSTISCRFRQVFEL